MICFHCQKEIPDDANYCPQCGVRLINGSTPETEPDEPSALENEAFEILTVDLPGLQKEATPLELVRIPEGEFLMGNIREPRSSKRVTPHKVTISSPFYMGKYPVTQAQWKCVMKSNPSYFKPYPNHPVEQISWFDCEQFLYKLNAKGLGTFRLASEAEWEYACRAGTRTINYWGNELTDSVLNHSVWYEMNSGGITHEVGQKEPNPWGLYDMQGNVWEWCRDWYGNLSTEAQVDPSGPATGSARVIRGGSCLVGSKLIRSYTRNFFLPGNSHRDLGMRVVRLI